MEKVIARSHLQQQGRKEHAEIEVCCLRKENQADFLPQLAIYLPVYDYIILCRML